MFTPEETQSLLAEKGIGKTVLQRLQQMGLDDVAKLAAAEAGRLQVQKVHAVSTTSQVPARTVSGVVGARRRRPASGSRTTMTG